MKKGQTLAITFPRRHPTTISDEAFRTEVESSLGSLIREQASRLKGSRRGVRNAFAGQDYTKKVKIECISRSVYLLFRAF